MKRRHRNQMGMDEIMMAGRIDDALPTLMHPPQREMHPAAEKGKSAKSHVLFCQSVRRCRLSARAVIFLSCFGTTAIDSAQAYTFHSLL